LIVIIIISILMTLLFGIGGQFNEHLLFWQPPFVKCLPSIFMWPIIG